MDNNTIYNVKNRSASKVFYKIPEIGVRREFMPGEVKKITYDELQKLSYQAGGRELMADFLQIQSSEMLNELNMRVEPEYNMSEEQIKNTKFVEIKPHCKINFGNKRIVYK